MPINIEQVAALYLVAFVFFALLLALLVSVSARKIVEHLHRRRWQHFQPGQQVGWWTRVTWPDARAEAERDEAHHKPVRGIGAATEPPLRPSGFTVAQGVRTGRIRPLRGEDFKPRSVGRDPRFDGVTYGESPGRAALTALNTLQRDRLDIEAEELAGAHRLDPYPG